MNKKEIATLQETFREAKVEHDKRELNNRIKMLEKENEELKNQLGPMNDIKGRNRYLESANKGYRDENFNLADTVARYESHWFVRIFLKRKVNRKP